MPLSRRDFVRNTAAATTALLATSALAADTAKPASQPVTKAASTTANSRPSLAVIGCGGISRWHGGYLKNHVDIVALADTDKTHLASYNKEFAGDKAFTTGRYQDVLERDDVDLVLVTTPDHWHTRIVADALRAGKDVYCEKPLTLTIDEGRFIRQITRESGRVFQIGSQQRSESQFLTAVALAHAGRLGKIYQVQVVIGDTPKGANFKTEKPPAELDWDYWLGQAPKTPYIKERSHFNYRWWYEYSGGRITDWGAHHVDIAQWAVAPDLPGPKFIEPLECDLTVPYEHGYATIHNAYNTASTFNVKCTFANGVEMFIRDKAPNFPADNGILIQGDGGWLFVNREKSTGPAFDSLKDDPLPEGAVRKTANVPIPHERHFINFLECVRTRNLMPNSDVYTHTQNLATCHLANIALRLNRKLRWDATAQEIVADEEANSFLSRKQRKGYEAV
jgi:predicted dehydrogenase